MVAKIAALDSTTKGALAVEPRRRPSEGAAKTVLQFAASAAVFSGADVGSFIRMGGGKAMVRSP